MDTFVRYDECNAMDPALIIVTTLKLLYGNHQHARGGGFQDEYSE
jgi:hypothetical protein